MGRQKLWSPGKTKPGWVLWHERRGVSGAKNFFIHKEEAAEAVRNAIEHLVGQELTHMDEGEPGEPDPVRATLLEIRRLLPSRPWEALEGWEHYHRNFVNPDSTETIHVEDAFVHGV